MASSVKAAVAFVSGLVLSLTGGVYYLIRAQRGVEPVVAAQQEVQSARKAQPEIDAESAIIGISEAVPARKSPPATKSRTEILLPKPESNRSRLRDHTHALAMLRPPSLQRSLAPTVQVSLPPAMPPQLHTIIIPTGTQIAVRLIDSLSTDCNYIGDTFWAALDLPIVISGVIVAERGAKVSGTIIKRRASGRLGAAAELRLTLTGIDTAEGESLHIVTNQYVRVTSCGTRLNATTVGGRAISGNIMDAISDSKRLGGESVLKEVHAVGVESSTTAYETRLIFTLASPVTVRTKSGVERSK